MHILPWPAQCSDLNPIEHLWDYLDRKISCSEGKFHQVKKMFLSVGVKVISLKRIQFGPWSLDDNLQEGDYRLLNSEELTSIRDFLRKSG